MIKSGMKKEPAEVRFRRMVSKDADCWLWLGTKNQGYGQFWDGTKTVRAHRWSYEFHIGPIPEGLPLDHLCRNPSCVNPDHLEPVSNHENTMRGIGPSAANAAKTVCDRGHEFTPENTYIVAGTGWRHCQTCVKDKRDQANAERRRARWVCPECGKERALAVKARHLRTVHGIVRPKRWTP